MGEFRRKNERDAWHWVSECSKWPDKGDFESMKESPGKGKVCTECKKLWGEAMALQKKFTKILYPGIALFFVGFFFFIFYEKALPETLIRLKAGAVLMVIGALLCTAAFIIQRTGTAAKG